jgi:hypothetical protein
MSLRTIAATIFFCSAILAWGVPRAYGALNAPAAPLFAAVSGTATAPVSPAPASATPGDAPTAAATPVPGILASPSPTTNAGGTAATAPPTEPTTAPATTTAPTATLSNAEQIALQQQLEQRGKTYLKALQAQDAAAITAMLAGRCAGTDVSALIARRRAEISAAAGVSIDQLTPLNQFVAHFDPFAGEAHTVLQLDDASGARIELPFADGWLLENGSWQSVNC